MKNRRKQTHGKKKEEKIRKYERNKNEEGV